MCGIAGILNLKGKPVNGVLKAMTDAIAHRGPDGEGFHEDGPMEMGHRRLAIIDLSPAGKQPMANEDETLWLAYNGEVYNFRELRAELEAKGHRFRSKTDSEVILHGFEEEGTAFFKRLNGMFAFSLWDKKKRKLYLVRDRHGIKPLYYYQDAEVFLYASEIKALLKHPRVSAGLNLNALNEYFTFQNLFKYHTLFKGIHLVPQANILTIGTDGVLHRAPYWDYDFTRPDAGMSENDAREQTLSLFSRAVNRQLVADVPVGAYLSGGMDSGSVVAVASRSIPRLSTFTCGFDLSEVTGHEANFDERRDAESLAAHFKTEHYEQVINATDIEWSLPRVIYHLEDLRLGMSYPNYYIARLASKFVKVCLSGAGGDELYAGYPWRYYRSFRSLNREEYFKEYYGFWQRLVPDESKSAFFTDDTWGAVEDKDTLDILRRVFTFNQSLSYNTPEDHIANSLYFEIKTFLHGLFLVQDRLSMASGLEERVPFMDNDLVDLAQRIPIRHKLKNLKDMKQIDEDELKKASLYFSQTKDGKNILRLAMEKVLPASVINRPKQGFSAPDESWYRGEAITYVRKILLDPKNVCQEFIRPEAVAKILHEHCEQGQNHRLLIWSLLCFEWWCRIYLRGDSVPELI